MRSITELTLEQITLSWFEDLGYQILHSPDIAPGEPQVERDSYSKVILKHTFNKQKRKYGITFLKGISFE